jgi:hypothetical protein
MRLTALAAILASTTMLGGCAGTIAGVSLGSISSFAGFASTIFTGADLGEHAASLITGKDCRFSESLVREDRKVCEETGSSATRNDFRGIFVERVEADGTVVYAAPKYMPASVGAGENDNNPDLVWQAIKVQKQREAAERLLANADQGLQIDVAALASGNLPSGSLSFLPVGYRSGTTAALDEEPASQTAAQPRDFSNPSASARMAARPAPVTTTAPDEPPVIDEKAFTLSMQIAQATGSGGPFIAPATNSKPVTSKLVNGEPVLVMRIAPVVTQVAAATTVEPSFAATTAETAPAPEPVSPQNLMTTLPVAANPFEEIVTEPAPPPVARTKPKPAPTEIAQAQPKPVKPKAAPPAPRIAPEDEAYQPPQSEAFVPTAPEIAEPVAAPVAPALPPVTENTPVATSGPAPLITPPQP